VTSAQDRTPRDPEPAGAGDTTAGERRERRTRVDLTRSAHAERRNAARGRRASDEEFWNSLPASVRESLAKAAQNDPPPASPATTPELVELDARILTLQSAIDHAWRQTTETDDGGFEANQHAQALIVKLAAELDSTLAQRIEAQSRTDLGG
jgi:inactivated superfamily I helicase